MSKKDETFVDAEQESVNKTWAGEKKKLQQMTLLGKIEYIFAYYKFHIIGILGVAILGGSLIYHYVSYQEPALSVIVVNSFNCSEEAESVIDSYLRDRGLIAKNECAVVYSDANSEINMNAGELMSKLDLYVSTQTADYLLGDMATVEYVRDHLGVMNDVRDYMPKELEELWADRLMEIEMVDVNDLSENPKTVKVMGVIDISGTKAQEFFGADEDVCYLMVSDVADYADNIRALFDMIYEMEKE